jgi:hypothetical protein
MTSKKPTSKPWSRNNKEKGSVTSTSSRQAFDGQLLRHLDGIPLLRH